MLSENLKQDKIVIVGFGNILMGDEGVGIHIIHRLQKLMNSLPENVELIDGGTASLDVLLSLKNVSKLIIVDAIQAENSPGEICKFKISQFQKSEMDKISLHEMSVIDALNALYLVGEKPKEICIIGITPKEIKPFIGLSKELENKVTEIISCIQTEIFSLKEKSS